MLAKLVCSSVAVVALGFLSFGLLAEEPVKKGTTEATPSTFDFDKPTVTREQVEAWRKKYAFESLKPRLEYERTGRPAPTPKLGADAEKQLTSNEVTEDGSYWQTRAQSLEMLHTMEVDEFVQRSGFGISRRPIPGAQYVEPTVREPIDVVKLPPLSDEETAHTATRLLHGDDAPANAAALLTLLPSRDDLTGFHSTSRQIFAAPWDYGLVKNVDQVAGFQAHGFGYAPYPPIDKTQPKPAPDPNNPVDEKRWQVTRLELVSLLKHATPRVYVTDHLPSMEELSSATAKTRDLGKFEAASLEKLRDGEEIQTSSTPNRIEMLGAVRASKQCMQCHDVPRGTLLGAFSYELRRDPPIKLAPTTAVVQ